VAPTRFWNPAASSIPGDPVAPTGPATKPFYITVLKLEEYEIVQNIEKPQIFLEYL